MKPKHSWHARRTPCSGRSAVRRKNPDAIAISAQVTPPEQWPNASSKNARRLGAARAGGARLLSDEGRPPVPPARRLLATICPLPQRRRHPVGSLCAVAVTELCAMRCDSSTARSAIARVRQRARRLVKEIEPVLEQRVREAGTRGAPTIGCPGSSSIHTAPQTRTRSSSACARSSRRHGPRRPGRGSRRRGPWRRTW